MGTKPVTPEAKRLKSLRHKKWAEENRDHLSAYMRKYNAEHPKSQEQKDQAISRSMKMNYGIDIHQYRQMLSEQKGLCKLCGKPPRKRRLVIDHCHKTGKIRGLLCNGCNRSLALLDNPELLRQAIKYKESVK